MIRIENYLQLGFRGIVFLECKDWEEKGGYQDEHIVQTLACYDKDGEPYKLVIHWVEKFRPRSGGGVGHFIKSKEKITQEQYVEFVKTHGVQDDSLYHQRRARLEKDKRVAEKKMQKIVPKCPICGSAMILRYRKKDNAPFWGCPGFYKSGCNGTRSINLKDFSQYNELSRLVNAV